MTEPLQPPGTCEFQSDPVIPHEEGLACINWRPLVGQEPEKEQGMDGLKFSCVKCSGPIAEPGALLFSPPIGDTVKKLHLCVTCWGDLYNDYLGMGIFNGGS